MPQVLDVTSKSCKLCHEEKELDRFYRHRRGGDGRRDTCKDCDKRKPRYRSGHVHQFDFERMAREQNFRCAICKDKVGVAKLQVDHCHETLQVRGLLCRRCNLGLGHFRDSSRALTNAISYLELYR